MTITPFPYQNEAVDQIDAFGGRALLALEQGLGKSLTSLWWLKRAQAFPTIIVCPAVVKYVWEREAVLAGMRASILESRKPPRAGGLGPRPRLVVINYDILHHWLPWLKQLRPELVIFDECQNLSGLNTLRTRAARELTATCPHVLCLSGTPLLNCPAELWPSLNILRPDLFPAFLPFATEYCSPEMVMGRWDYRGAAHLNKLHKLLAAELMIRRRKAEVLKDLPAKIHQVVPVRLTNEGYRVYNQAFRDFLGWLRHEDISAYNKAKRASAFVKTGYLMRICGRYKLPAVVNWANDFLTGSDEKLVMFGEHHKLLDVLQRRVEAKSVRLDGNTTGRLRGSTVEQFQRDSKTRVFIGQTRAAGVGTTLTAASNVCICELGYVPGLLAQAIDRCHRIGQKDTVWARYFVSQDTIEERLAKLHQKKQKNISAVLDGGPTENNVDLFDLLLTSLQEEETRMVVTGR